MSFKERNVRGNWRTVHGQPIFIKDSNGEDWLSFNKFDRYHAHKQPGKADKRKGDLLDASQKRLKQYFTQNVGFAEDPETSMKNHKELLREFVRLVLGGSKREADAVVESIDFDPVKYIIAPQPKSKPPIMDEVPKNIELLDLTKILSVLTSQNDLVQRHQTNTVLPSIDPQPQSSGLKGLVQRLLSSVQDWEPIPHGDIDYPEPIEDVNDLEGMERLKSILKTFSGRTGSWRLNAAETAESIGDEAGEIIITEGREETLPPEVLEDPGDENASKLPEIKPETGKWNPLHRVKEKWQEIHAKKAEEQKQLEKERPTQSEVDAAYRGSSAVYEVSGRNPQSETVNQDTINGLEKWKPKDPKEQENVRMGTYSKDYPNTGYTGAVFKVPNSHTYVIAHAGTEFADDLKKDFLNTDVPYGADRFPKQGEQAFDFTQNARKAILAEDPEAKIINTGHSLGGAHAQVGAMSKDFENENSKTITFNALGVRSQHDDVKKYAEDKGLRKL